MANKRKTASYRAALEWIARNDDCEWLDSEHGLPSATLSMVADLFGVESTEKAIEDLRRIHSEIWIVED